MQPDFVVFNSESATPLRSSPESLRETPATPVQRHGRASAASLLHQRRDKTSRATGGSIQEPTTHVERPSVCLSYTAASEIIDTESSKFMKVVGSRSRSRQCSKHETTHDRTTSRTCSNELLNVISIDDDRLRYRHFAHPELHSGMS